MNTGKDKIREPNYSDDIKIFKDGRNIVCIFDEMVG